MSIIDDDKNAINLSELLSQPLISTLEAEFYTAQRFLEFMAAIGLEEVSEENLIEGNTERENASLPRLSKPLKLKMVTFLYRQIDPSDRKEKLFQVQVPLISLIPLPLLQIDLAEYDFNIRVFSEISMTSGAASPGGLLKEGTSEEDSTTVDLQFKGLKARLSPLVGGPESGKNTRNVDANMRLKVHMRQADLPGGLAYWMSTFNNATSVKAVEVPQGDPDGESS